GVISTFAERRFGLATIGSGGVYRHASPPTTLRAVPPFRVVPGRDWRRRWANSSCCLDRDLRQTALPIRRPQIFTRRLMADANPSPEHPGTVRGDREAVGGAARTLVTCSQPIAFQS